MTLEKTDPNHVLFADRETSHWTEAYPLGNGSLGAMIRGGVDTERISLNEDTLWSGLPGNVFGGGRPEMLKKARKLIAERRFSGAADYIGENMLDRDSCSYQLAGDLIVDFAGGKADPAAAGEYRRTLDLRSAEAEVSFRRGKAKEARKYFVSFPDRLFAGKCVSSEKGGVSCSFRLESVMRHRVSADGDGALTLEGVCPVRNRYNEVEWEDEQGRTGLKYHIRLEVANEGGQKNVFPDRIEVKNADSVEFRLCIVSNFVDSCTMPEAGFEKLARRNAKTLADASRFDFEELEKRHLADHRSLFGRASLEMPPGENSGLPTSERIRRSAEEKDNALVGLLFNFGRYLTIAASRPGSRAMNLQGIWNDRFCPPWGCNYTTNINLQMNYWPTDAMDLGECTEPFFGFLRDWAENGGEAAKRLFGMEGWCGFHNSDVWGFASMATGKAKWGFWPMGGAWCCTHIMEHYRYTRDVEFLRRFYPLLEESCRFHLAFLSEDGEGKLIHSPSTSPENVFLDPVTGKEAAAAAMSAMDYGILTQLFADSLEAMKILKIEPGIREKLEDALPRLRRPEVGKYGELCEYGEVFEEKEIDHRHLSHLFGVYPGNSIGADRNADLYEAAKVAALRRGDSSTGWGMGWRLALQARFGNGERAWNILKKFFTLVEPDGEERGVHEGGLYANCFDACPPFQIDGNFGAAAAIAEMLVQSHRRDEEGAPVIVLLPALPGAWREGRLSGVRVRGGFKVSLEWKECSLSKVSIENRNDHAAAFTLVFGGVKKRVRLAPGETFRLR